jgi:uncharacterized protein with PQ loop repeat
MNKETEIPRIKIPGPGRIQFRPQLQKFGMLAARTTGAYHKSFNDKLRMSHIYVYALAGVGCSIVMLCGTLRALDQINLAFGLLLFFLALGLISLAVCLIISFGFGFGLKEEGKGTIRKIIYRSAGTVAMGTIFTSLISYGLGAFPEIHSLMIYPCATICHFTLAATMLLLVIRWMLLAHCVPSLEAKNLKSCSDQFQYVAVFTGVGLLLELYFPIVLHDMDRLSMVMCMIASFAICVWVTYCIRTRAFEWAENQCSGNESSILACLFLIAADICFLGVIKSYSCSLIEKFIANAEDPQEDSTIFDSSEAE